MPHDPTYDEEGAFNGWVIDAQEKRIKELEAEVATLRQDREDAHMAIIEIAQAVMLATGLTLPKEE